MNSFKSLYLVQFVSLGYFLLPLQVPCLSSRPWHTCLHTAYEVSWQGSRIQPFSVCAMRMIVERGSFIGCLGPADFLPQGFVGTKEIQYTHLTRTLLLSLYPLPLPFTVP